MRGQVAQFVFTGRVSEGHIFGEALEFCVRSVPSSFELDNECTREFANGNDITVFLYKEDISAQLDDRNHLRRVLNDYFDDDEFKHVELMLEKSEIKRAIQFLHKRDLQRLSYSRMSDVTLVMEFDRVAHESLKFWQASGAGFKVGETVVAGKKSENLDRLLEFQGVLSREQIELALKGEGFTHNSVFEHVGCVKYTFPEWELDKAQQAMDGAKPFEIMKNIFSNRLL